VYLILPEAADPLLARYIKRHSAYRAEFVVVEYRWHPLYRKELPVKARTKVGSDEIIRVESNHAGSHELPSWMVDASICRGMELGTPQVSVAALVELRAFLDTLSPPARERGAFVSSNEEAEFASETSPETISSPTAPVAARNTDRLQQRGAQGTDRRTRRSAVGGGKRQQTRNGGAE